MTRKLIIVLEEPYRRMTIDYLNCLFGGTQKSADHWNSILKNQIHKYFPNGLSSEELNASHNLKMKDPHNLSHLLNRIISLMGMKFSPYSRYVLDVDLKWKMFGTHEGR